MEKATFAAGCFWGVEHQFGKLPGGLKTEVGYAGGHVQNPTYQQLCTDRTGHAEVVQIEFDPARLSYEALLRHFFEMHNPTTRNRQGPDIGTQYRSAVFFHSPQQQALAQRVIAELNQARYGGAIVTELVPAQTFWRAENYHQKYAEKHPGHACAL